MNDIEILKTINLAKESFGKKCSKYCGALTTEIIRKELKESGIFVSARDVFIRGLAVEIDLLIYRDGVTPENGILFEPEDVLVTIEVKNAGSFGDNTIQTIQHNSEKIKNLNKQIKYCYITLAERKNYKWAITDVNSGCETYTLFWHTGADSNRVDVSTGDWSRFLLNMKKYQVEA